MSSYQIVFTVDGELSVKDDASYWYICNAPYGLELLDVDLAIKMPPFRYMIDIDIEKSSDGTSWSSLFNPACIFGAHEVEESSSTLIDLDGPFAEDTYIVTSGSHDGPNDANSLTDSTASFKAEYVGYTIENTTDGSSGMISSVSSSTNLSVTLRDGAGNDWDTDDGYTIIYNYLKGLCITRDPDNAAGYIAGVASRTHLYALSNWRTSTHDQYRIARAGGILPGTYIGVGGTLIDTEIIEGDMLRLDVRQCGGWISGSHDGLDGSSILTDSTATFSSGLIGYTVENTTDKSAGKITGTTATTISAVLSGGTDNNWGTSDGYNIDTPGVDLVVSLRVRQ